MSRVFAAWLVALTAVSSEAPAGPSQAADVEARLASVYRAAYALDQERALANARAAVVASPRESRAHRALAAVLWLEILFRRGTVTIDHYVGGLGKSSATLPKPSAAHQAEFKQAIERAIALSTERLDANPADVEARFDLGSAHALQASYLASVDDSLTSAFMSARRAFDAQEEVLARDASRMNAAVIVGTYRYMISSLALPSRLFAYMAGFGGGKERGIAMLEAAAKDQAARVEARTALTLIYSREGRHADAFRVLGELAAEFPGNRLFVLEQGSAAIRAGKYAEADALLTSGLLALDRDRRPRMPGERGLWLYKRGLARFWRDRRSEAAADLQEAIRNGPVDWVRGRAVLTLGKIADLNGRRQEAEASYRTARQIGLEARDSTAAADAARWLRRPYSAGTPR
jgi:tetratricopeptide (TPR) repeat protein